MRSRGQAALEFVNLYSETVTCNLHDMAQGRYRKANGSRHADYSFITNHAGFHCFPVFSCNQQGKQTAIREISELQISSGLVKDVMLTELKRLQMRLNDAIFNLWNRQKNFVFKRRDPCPCYLARLRVPTN
jgi:hypothetical protein